MLAPRTRWSLCLLLACTPVDGGDPPRSEPAVAPTPSTPVAAEPTPVAVEPEREAEPTPRAHAEPMTWVWNSPRVVGELQTWLPMPAAVRNGDTRVEARARDGGRIEVVQSHRGSTQWTTIVGAPSDEAAALAWAGDVLVAHYHPMSSGADLTRLDGDTGKPIWSVPLRARGQVDHSKYRNDVQLRVAAGLVWVYGWESDGAYVETRSLEDGFMDNHLRVERGLPDIDWRAVPETTFDPSIVWPHAVDDCSTGASLEHDGMTYVVQACSISSGARLSARPSRGSEWTWHANLLGIGPISHSAYSNRVALEWKDDHLVVYGDEAMGRYVEVIETRTGATVVNKRWIMP